MSDFHFEMSTPVTCMLLSSPVCPSAQEALDALSVNAASPALDVPTPADNTVAGRSVSTMQSESRILISLFFI